MAGRVAHHYAIFGLTLSSPIEIPGLAAIPGSDPGAYRLHFGTAREAVPFDDAAGTKVTHLDTGAELRFADGTTARLDVRQREIRVEAPPDATSEDTATYVTGAVAGFLARMEGRFCLHAAVVVVGGEAVVVAGESEWGKSTTAAAFAKEGFPVLSDDVCAIERGAGGLIAHPGSPRIRLWPDGASMVYGEDHALPRITPTWEKLYVDLEAPGRFEPRPCRVREVWVIGAETEGECLTGSRALTTLLSCVYMAAHGSAAMRRSDLEVAAEVCESVPVRVLPGALDPFARVRAVVGGSRLAARRG